MTCIFPYSAQRESVGITLPGLRPLCGSKARFSASMCVQFSPAEREQMLMLKRAFDAAGTLNPGKVIPTLARCAEYGKMHVKKGLLPFPELERF